jgi:hypothetical protein
MSYEVSMSTLNDVFLNLEGEPSTKQGKTVCILHKSNLYKAMYQNSVCDSVVVHAFNLSTWEAEAGGFLSSRPAWSTE